jgi:hypothetical protein
MTALLDLPEESLCIVSHFLLPCDILHFISIHPTIHRLLGHSKHFWSDLCQIHYKSDDVSRHSEGDWKLAKHKFLLNSCCNTLSTVRWYPVQTTTPRRRWFNQQTDAGTCYQPPTPREGHVSCVIGNYIVLTGGFTDDDSVYIKNVKDLNDGTAWRRIRITSNNNNNTSSQEQLPQIRWVYGATLTTLNDTQAILYGGFQAGGYSSETSQVALLHLEESSGRIDEPKVWWEVVQLCRLADGSSCTDSNASWLNIAGRAYHSATLLFSRYLFIVGGMQSRGSILSPIILDCITWTWYFDSIAGPSSSIDVNSGNSRQLAPSVRHGCSVIADNDHRNRLVLFGGGNGSDLLRSGWDNSEVWELNLNGCTTADHVLTSMPWTWRMVHGDQANRENEDNTITDDEDPNPNRLSPVEKLNLGRCHAGYRVGRDTAIFAFGSGRPSTNSVLCYNLSTNNFFRTRVHDSYIPRARFTFASAFVESKGILVFNGGYTTQHANVELSDTIILDVAPAMNTRQADGRLWLPINNRARSNSAISDENIPTYRHRNGHNALVVQLIELTQDERQVACRQMLSMMDESQRDSRLGMLLTLGALGQLLMSEDIDREIHQFLEG